jgi:hypothetical protein
MIAVEWNLPPECNDALTCHLWAFVRLLTWYGVDNAAPIYGCACTFAADLSGEVPDVASWPPDWGPGATRIFGMRLEEADNDDFARGWAAVVQRIAAGHPTIIVANVHHLPFHYHYRIGSYGHCITVIGYDEARREAHLVDNGPSRWRGALPLEQLQAACDIRGLPNGKNVQLRYFDILPPSRPVSMAAIAAADAAEVLHSMQRGIAGTDPVYESHPGHRCRGSAGIRALADRLGRLAPAWGVDGGKDDAVGTALMALHLAAVAVAELRAGAQDSVTALAGAGRLRGAEDAARAVALDFAESRRLWRLAAAMFIRALAGKAEGTLVRIVGRLCEIADLEDHAATLLPRIAAAVR